jgi:hypothetical protein
MLKAAWELAGPASPSNLEPVCFACIGASFLTPKSQAREYRPALAPVARGFLWVLDAGADNDKESIGARSLPLRASGRLLGAFRPAGPSGSERLRRPPRFLPLIVSRCVV